MKTLKLIILALFSNLSLLALLSNNRGDTGDETEGDGNNEETNEDLSVDDLINDAINGEGNEDDNTNANDDATNNDDEPAKIKIGDKEYTEEEFNTFKESHENYTQRQQALSDREAEIKEVEELNSFFQANPDKLKKVKSLLTGEDDFEGDADKLGDELDDDEDMIDPAIKKLIDKHVLPLKEKIEKYEQSESSKDYQEKVRGVQEVMTGAIDESLESFEKLTDGEEDVLKKAIFKEIALDTYMPKDNEDVKKRVKEIGQQVIDRHIKQREAYIAHALKSKKAPNAQGQGGGKNVMPAKPNMDNLEDVLVNEFEQLEKE